MNKVKLVKQLDLFSNGFSLNVNGDSSYKTLAGLLFTVAYAGGLLAVTTVQFQSYFDTTSPIAVTDSFSTAVYPQVNLIDNGFYPAIIPYSNETEPIKSVNISQYLTIKFQKVIWNTTIDASGVASLQKNFQDFPTIPCSELTAEEKQRFEYMGTNSTYFSMLPEFGICTRLPTDTTVEGKGSDDFYTLFSVKILPCSLTSGCKSAAEIAKVNFLLVLPSLNYNASNKADPMKTIVTLDDIYYINPPLKQTYTGKIRQQKISDLVGVYPSWEITHSLFEIGSLVLTSQFRTNAIMCSPEQIAINDNPQCQPYFEYVLQSSGGVIVNRRSYQTLIETLGNIGGTTQIIFIALVFIYSPIDSRQKRKYILEKVYPLLGEKDIGAGKQQLEAKLPQEKNAEEAKPANLNQLPPIHRNRPTPSENTVSPRHKSLARKSTFLADFGQVGSPQAKVELSASTDKANESSTGTTSFWDKFRCLPICKKKTPEEEVHDKRINDAFDRIESSLDVLNILRYFNLIVVMSNIFFEDQHFELAQYVGFDLWRHDHEAQKEAQKNKKKVGLCGGGKADEDKERIDQAKAKFHESLTKLQKKASGGGKDQNQISKRVKALVNTFYFSHMFGEDADESHESDEIITHRVSDDRMKEPLRTVLEADDPPRPSSEIDHKDLVMNDSNKRLLEGPIMDASISPSRYFKRLEAGQL